MSEETPEWPISSNIISSLQEGQEWVTRLETELHILLGDLIKAEGLLSEVSVAALKYTIVKTNEAIEQIKLEMMLYE